MARGKNAKLNSDKQRDFGDKLYAPRSKRPGRDKWYKRMWNRKARRTKNVDLED